MVEAVVVAVLVDTLDATEMQSLLSIHEEDVCTIDIAVPLPRAVNENDTAVGTVLSTAAVAAPCIPA